MHVRCMLRHMTINDSRVIIGDFQFPKNSDCWRAVGMRLLRLFSKVMHSECLSLLGISKIGSEAESPYTIKLIESKKTESPALRRRAVPVPATSIACSF